MTELDVTTHRETIRWFIENPEKGVWTRRKDNREWRWTSNPSFDSEEIFVINDEFQGARRAQKDGETIECCIDFDQMFPPHKGEWYAIGEMPTHPVGGLSHYRVKGGSDAAELNRLP